MNPRGETLVLLRFWSVGKPDQSRKWGLMSQMKRRSDNVTPLTQRVRPVEEEPDSPNDAEKAAWNDRLAAARAEREAVLADRARTGASKAQPLKPWERAEAAAAQRRKYREETGLASRKPMTADTSVVAAAAAAAAESLPRLEQGDAQLQVLPDTAPAKDRRLQIAALLFFVGLGAGILIAAPERVGNAVASIQALVAKTETAETVGVPTGSSKLIDGSIAPEARSRGADPLGMSDIRLAQTSFRLGPPEPFAELSRSPRPVAKSFFSVQQAPKLLAAPARNDLAILVVLPERALPQAQAATEPRLSVVTPSTLTGPEFPVSAMAQDAGPVTVPQGPVAPVSERAITLHSLVPPVHGEGVIFAAEIEAETTAARLVSRAEVFPESSGLTALALQTGAGPAPLSLAPGFLQAPTRPGTSPIGASNVRLASLALGLSDGLQSPRVVSDTPPLGIWWDAEPDRSSRDTLLVPPQENALSIEALSPIAEPLLQIAALQIPDRSSDFEARSAWSDNELRSRLAALLPTDREDTVSLSPDQTSPPVSSTGVVPHAFPGTEIFLWAPNGTSANRIEEAEASIRNAGFELDGARRLDIRITQDQVRYFQPEYREAAEVVAEAIGARLRDFTNFRPAPAEGTIEIWLETGGQPPPRVIARNPTPRPTQAQREQQQIEQIRSRLLRAFRDGNL